MTDLPSSARKGERPLVPDARIVYASFDTATLAHAHAPAHEAPKGAVAYVRSRFDDPGKNLRAAAETLDLDRPITVVLLSAGH